MSRKDEEPEVNLSRLLAETIKTETDVRDGAAVFYKLFESFTAAGFTRPEALQLLMHQMTLNQTPPQA